MLLLPGGCEKGVGMKLFSREQKFEKINQTMSIVKILTLYPLAREVFKRNGIEFIGKELSPLESLERVAKGNSLSDKDIESIVQEINKGIDEKGKALFEGELLRVTSPAAAKLKEFIEAKKGKKGIRLRLASDGCGLYSYDMDFGTKRLEGELAFEANGITFYLERKTIGLLKGTEIDFLKDGFFFNNPNVKDSSPQNMKTVAVVKDLFFRTKIEGAAKRSETPIHFLDTADTIQGAELIFLDLEEFGADSLPGMKERNPGARIIGYLSHVNIDLRKKAEQAGCDLVLPRSEFSKRLPELLSEKS